MATSSRIKAIKDNIQKIRENRTAASLRNIPSRVDGVPF
jgi:hypothetical protein